MPKKMEGWAKVTIWLMKPHAVLQQGQLESYRLIKETVVLTLGKEGRVSLLSCTFLLCEQPSVTGQHLMICPATRPRQPASTWWFSPATALKTFFLHWWMDQHRCVTSPGLTQSTKYFWCARSCLSSHANMQCCYHLKAAELILTYAEVSWKLREIKFQLKFGHKCKCLPNYGLYTWPDAWFLFSGLQMLKKILQLWNYPNSLATFVSSDVIVNIAKKIHELWIGDRIELFRVKKDEFSVLTINLIVINSHH